MSPGALDVPSGMRSVGAASTLRSRPSMSTCCSMPAMLLRSPVTIYFVCDAAGLLLGRVRARRARAQADARFRAVCVLRVRIGRRAGRRVDERDDRAAVGPLRARDRWAPKCDL